MTAWVELGSGVWYSFHTCRHSPNTPSGALVRFGGAQDEEAYDHDEVCVGGISWCPECRGATWELRSLDPLHVEPSIQTTCRNHPVHHGYIRGGRWETC